LIFSVTDNTLVSVGTLNTIRSRMKQRRVTQTELAGLLCLSNSAVSRRMRGEVAFRLSELWLIANHLDATVAELLEDSSLADTG
jgi:transcriptional regulator with XRE-family HTH domain